MTHIHGARPRPRTAPETVRRIVMHLVEGREDAHAWDRLLARHHYLGRSRLVGEALRYVAVVDGEPVALVGFASAALQVGVRDAAIGWTPDQREDRLRYVVNNARFVILPRFQIANLGSHVLGLTLRRLSADWQAVHGHPVLACETFVDPAHFLGTVYASAGFTYLGDTAGFRRQAPGYTARGASKRVYLRPLRRKAGALLRQEFLTPALLARGPRVDPNTLPLDGPQGLVAALAAVPEMRHRRGVRHPLATTLAVAVLGLMCGMPGYRAIGQWAQSLTPAQRQRLGCFRSPTTGRWVVPSIETLRRTLIAVDPDALSTAVATYLARVRPSTGPLALDGKTRRHSASATEAQRHLLGVVRHRLLHLVAQADVGEKENEIPVAQRVLATLPLEDTIVTADALHTQTATAQLIGDRGGEYLLTVKANQPSLHQLLANSLPWDFSPSPDGGREGPRPDRNPHDSGVAGLARDRVPVRPAGGPADPGDGAVPQHD